MSWSSRRGMRAQWLGALLVVVLGLRGAGDARGERALLVGRRLLVRLVLAQLGRRGVRRRRRGRLGLGALRADHARGERALALAVVRLLARLLLAQLARSGLLALPAVVPGAPGVRRSISERGACDQRGARQ